VVCPGMGAVELRGFNKDMYIKEDVKYTFTLTLSRKEIEALEFTLAKYFEKEKPSAVTGYTDLAKQLFCSLSVHLDETLKGRGRL